MLKKVYFLLDEASLRVLESIPEGQRSKFVRACFRALGAGLLKWVPESPRLETPEEKEEVVKSEG